MKIGLIILAAGASTRLGRPKQLVSFKGKKLLQHVIDCTEGLTLASCVLIVGANSDEVLQETNNKSFFVCINENWKEGMASSLRLGVEKSLQTCFDLNAILILVSDQPFVSTELLTEMIDLYKSESDIIACEYDGVKGVPVLFGSEYFEELKRLKGDQGARKLIANNEEKVKAIPFAQGNFDIDTPEDLNRLKNWN